MCWNIGSRYSRKLCFIGCGVLEAFRKYGCYSSVRATPRSSQKSMVECSFQKPHTANL